MKWLQKLISSDQNVSCGRILALFFALQATALITYIVFIRSVPLTEQEEKLIEFLAGFAVCAYGGAKAGDTISGRQ